MPKFNLKQLTGIDPPKMSGHDYRLQPEAAQAFDKLRMAAENDNIKISVVSSFRSYEHQQQIWSNKYDAYIADGLSPLNAIGKIIEYSTLPGTSRHHWGTELDLIPSGIVYPGNDPLLPELFAEEAPFFGFKKWMDGNAGRFGFYEVYTNNPDRSGFKYEPWHFSFEPLSVVMLSDFLVQLAKEPMHYDALPGASHLSSEFFDQYIQNHLLGINPELNKT